MSKDCNTFRVLQHNEDILISLLIEGEESQYLSNTGWTKDFFIIIITEDENFKRFFSSNFIYLFI